MTLVTPSFVVTPFAPLLPHAVSVIAAVMAHVNVRSVLNRMGTTFLGLGPFRKERECLAALSHGIGLRGLDEFEHVRT